MLDVDNMDSLMMADSESVTIRSCPFCRQPIINTYRYKDLINDMFRKEINPIKRKIYGSKKEIEIKKEQLILKASTLLEAHKIDYRGEFATTLPFSLQKSGFHLISTYYHEYHGTIQTLTEIVKSVVIFF